MLILKRATSHLGFSRWRLSKRRSPALMGRKANDHELSLGETPRETILNPLNAAKSDDESLNCGLRSSLLASQQERRAAADGIVVRRLNPSAPRYRPQLPSDPRNLQTRPLPTTRTAWRGCACLPVPLKQNQLRFGKIPHPKKHNRFYSNVTTRNTTSCF